MNHLLEILASIFLLLALLNVCVNNCYIIPEIPEQGNKFDNFQSMNIKVNLFYFVNFRSKSG